MTHLIEAMRVFTDYQHRHNLPKYAKTATARVGEFIAYCEADGVVNAADVTPANIRKYLAQTPKRQFPGAWRSRYTAVKTFFNYLVFVGKLRPEDNPMQTTPTGESLTNKLMLSPLEFDRLLLVIPRTHIGIQDKLCSQLLWSGYSLQQINQLNMNDVHGLPNDVRQTVDDILRQRAHLTSESLFLSPAGQPQHIYGQKLNRRLQKYAGLAGLPESNRVTSSLLYQSGTYHRLSNPQYEEVRK